jgi:hypothetical protein
MPFMLFRRSFTESVLASLLVFTFGCASQNAGVHKISDTPHRARAWHINTGLLAGDYRDEAEKKMAEYCSPSKVQVLKVDEAPASELINKVGKRYVDFECVESTEK